KKRPTLKTIAEITGFAVPTVSRALSDAPDIGAATKAKVLKVAKDLGYVPNHEGLRLRTGKTMNIALVLAILDKVTDHSGMLIAAVARALRGTGYTLSITPYSPTDDPLAAVRQVVETKQADAIIIEQIKQDDLRVRFMAEEGFPFVMYGRTEVPGNFHFYDFDNHAFGVAAADTLITKGRKRILVILPPLDQTYARHIVEGIDSVLSPLGVEPEIMVGVHSLKDRQAAYDTIYQRLAEGPAPDGLICCASREAVVALRAMRQLDIRVGQDVDIFVKESFRLLGDIDSNVMTYFEDVEKAGAFLAKAAVRAIEEPDAPALQFVDRADWTAQSAAPNPSPPDKIGHTV
ncbi:MAG: LacI family DNA-binding transcriptional regulator, partial [Pseudomonadota bacterium]